MKNTGGLFGSSLTPQQPQTTNPTGFFQTSATTQPQQGSLTGFNFNKAPETTTTLSTEKAATLPFSNSVMQPTSSNELFEKTSSNQAGQSNGLGGLLSSTTTNDRLQNKTTTSLFGSNSTNAGSFTTNTLGLSSNNQFPQSNTSGGFFNNSGNNTTSQTSVPQNFFGTTSNTLTPVNASSTLLSNSSTTTPTQTGGTTGFFATNVTNPQNETNSLFKTTTPATNQPFQLAGSTNLFGNLSNNDGNKSTLGGNLFGTNSNTPTPSLTLPTNLFSTSKTNNTPQTNSSTLPPLTTADASQAGKQSTMLGSTSALNLSGNKDTVPSIFNVSSTQNTPKEASGVNSGSMTGLFGSFSVAQQSDAAPSNVTGNSLFSSTSGLFSKTTPSFATTTANATQDNSLTSNPKQSPATGNVTTSEKNTLEGSTSNENTTTTITAPNASLLQGLKSLNDSKANNETLTNAQATNSLFETTKTSHPKQDLVTHTGGLFGKTQENALTSNNDIKNDNKGQLGLFKGNESTGDIKNMGLNNPGTGNSIKPSNNNVSKDNLNFADGTLDEYQYERIDQLLSQWDQRVKRQVADFQKYAKVVATLDLDLCHSVSTLETVERNQLAIEKKMYEINSSLDQIENQQISLESCLENIQGVLESHMGDTDTKHPLKGRLQTITTTLDDAETVVDQLTKDVNNIQEALHPGPLGDVITMLNLHQRSLDVLTDEAHQLRDCLSQIGRHDFTNSTNTTTT